MAKSRAPRRPLWLIANQENGRMGVFTLCHGDEGKVLPIFSFEEEAEIFLRLGKTETGWRGREATSRELILLLDGLCADVNRVALDPLPAVDGETAFDLAGWSRRDFLRDFIGATSALCHKRRREATVTLGLQENPDGNGTPLRETEGERGRRESSAVPHKPERMHRGPLDEEDNTIPDYMMRNFAFPEEAGEDLAWDCE